MTIEELSQQDSRESDEFIDFVGFSDENPTDALADIRLGRGEYHSAGDDFSRFDDGDSLDLSDYVPSWA